MITGKIRIHSADAVILSVFVFSSSRRHTRSKRDWSSDVCSSDLGTTRGEGVVRGVGYGLGLKNLCFSEGFDDYSTARVRLEVVAGEPVVLVHTAAAEVGQGLVTVKGQIARTELGVEKVVIAPSDTQVGSAGSSSASRQTYMTGGAVKLACASVRDEVVQLARQRGLVPEGLAWTDLSLSGGKLVSATWGVLVSLADLLGEAAQGGVVVEHTREYHHRP